MSHYLPHFPSDRMRLLYVETELQLRSLVQSVAAHAAPPAARARPASPRQAGGHDTIPPALLAEARRLLAAVARLMAREKHWRGGLGLAAAPGWPELLAKLALAEAALRRFAAIYLEPAEDDAAEPDADSLPLAPGLEWR